ncbi:uncharacterized protein LOC111069689 [Drosophila obscura]|uniref:uncharacterized protein LOC111069689 n=1 Tax=Drosophila obscura TaxID=7282 RepID=UPI000BA09004|nr:uncharacterized protein LOC111069689 [Drosophila obscura]
MAKTKNGPSTIKKRLEQQVALLRRELATSRVDQNDLCRKYATTVRQQAGSVNVEESLMLKEQIKMLEKLNHEQRQYISYLEEHIKMMPAEYESRMIALKKSAKLAEMELNKVYQGIHSIKDQVKEVDKLRNCLNVLKARLKRRDFIIAQYEAKNSNRINIVDDQQGQNMSQVRHKQGHTTTHKKLIVLPSKRQNTPEPTDVPAESETEPQGTLLIDKYKRLQDLRPPPKKQLRSVDFSCLAAALRIKGNQDQTDGQ